MKICRRHDAEHRAGANGALSSINSGLQNLAVHKVEGVDISLSHSMSVFGGLLDLNYVASYMEEVLRCMWNFSVR